MPRGPTFLPSTPWIPVVGLQVRLARQVVEPAEAHCDAAWTWASGTWGTEAWAADLGTRPRTWERFGVRLRGGEKRE